MPDPPLFDGLDAAPAFEAYPPVEGYEATPNALGEVSDATPGMCGLTSYNCVEGHFFLANLPSPDGESISRTIQGIADTFESQYDDPAIGTLVGLNDQVALTNVVYTGEVFSAITKSTVATYTATSSPNNKHSSVILQGGLGYHDGSNNRVASDSNKIVAIAVDDVRPFALKGLDTEHTALFDMNDPAKPTDGNYIRHLTPQKESRVATIDIPSSLQTAAGLPPKVLVYYNAIDLTGEVVAAWKGSAFATLSNTHKNASNDLKGINSASSKGWLVVERTVPDANTVYVDTSGTGTGNHRTLADWITKPFIDSTGTPATTWTPLEIHAPGGIITIPSKQLDRPIVDHSLRMNPTGDITNSPFINIENCAHTVVQGSISGFRDKSDGYGVPVAQPNTRSPVAQNEANYHSISFTNQGQNDFSSIDDVQKMGGGHRLLNLEQFNIIDNVFKADRHEILIQPKNTGRANALSTLVTRRESPTNYHLCTVELALMRGRVEEITPATTDEGQATLSVRGRSQIMDIADRVAERDFNLSEGVPIKEIGDLGSPSVSLSLGGLGQGGIDIKPTRTEHSFLPVWKDKIIGTGNPSVRNDRQTSTYYASTRALVEIPLFPSMFYDVEKRLPDSENKRTPLPSDNSMEMVIDCTMTASNRPQMKEYESRWSIDWGQRNKIASLKVNDYEAVKNIGGLGSAWIRAMRENAQTFTRRAVYPDATEESCIVGGSVDSNCYIEVDNVYPFITEGGMTVATPSGSAPALTWDFDTFGAAITGVGFVVTIGEGILNERGIRFHVWKVAIVDQGSGNLSHRLYINGFQDFDDDATTFASVKGRCCVGLPVVMGSWISNRALSPSVTTNMNALNAATSTSASTMAQSFISPIEKVFGKLRSGHDDDKTSICIDPNDDSNILILDGPTMEAFTFDPGNYLYGQDDIPLMPPIECRSAYLALKGKRNDDTLDYVRPMAIKLGDVASAGTVTKFEEAVDELIRRINQAGHPKAKNTAGGSAFNPPTLFDEDEGTHTVTSTDSGSHMGYVRAFLGGDVESRDGESGVSIVIHSTIPGAASRNFAIWFNNYSPYEYKPIQAVGHGGLVATNSRSYQASSFPAPLPLGMDGDTYIPITTFQGAVHGAVENEDNELRTYEGIGTTFTFNTVRNPKDDSDNDMPDYDPDVQSTLFVERKALDMIRRVSKPMTKGIILVDEKHLGQFDGVSYGVGGTVTFGKSNGPGSCAGLLNVQPMDKSLTKKWRDIFYDKNGNIKEVPIRVLSPLVDAHGILFFGGGHTGVTFDVSDGTANDYSDFYTHHYSKGPTGYSGLQNLQEIQTSAAVLDFTEIRNRDTVKENTYSGKHHLRSIVGTGYGSEHLYKEQIGALFYVRLNESEMASDFTTGKEIVAESKYGIKLKAVGDWSSTLQSSGPITVDGESKGVLFNGTKKNALSLHRIEKLGGEVSPRVPLKAQFIGPAFGETPADDGNWTVSFFFKPGAGLTLTNNWGTGANAGHGCGPVIQGIDTNGDSWGVSIHSKQGSDDDEFTFYIRGWGTQTGGDTFVSSSNALVDQPKNAWYHVTVGHYTGTPGTAAFSVNGVVIARDTNDAYSEPNYVTDAAYDGSTHRHLPEGIGCGKLVDSNVREKNGTDSSAGVMSIEVDTTDATTQFSVGDEVWNASGQYVGKIASLDATNIHFEEPTLNAVANLTDLYKVTPLSSGHYGRTKDMVTIGVSLLDDSPASGYYNGEKSGSGNNDPNYFKGILSEIALWDTYMSASDITALYNARTVWD